MTSYSVEPLAIVRPELEELLPLHWQEIARDKEVIRLSPDWAAYHALEDAGQFFMLCCRVDGRLAGYIIGFVRPHLHYVESLSFICDIFYIRPEHRAGRIGIQLFKEAEKALRARGVQKMFLGCKVAKDLTPIFTRLGFKKIEYVFAKLLGE